jgi:hypothetical protein
MESQFCDRPFDASGLYMEMRGCAMCVLVPRFTLIKDGDSMTSSIKREVQCMRLHCSQCVHTDRVAADIFQYAVTQGISRTVRIRGSAQSNESHNGNICFPEGRQI